MFVLTRTCVCEDVYRKLIKKKQRENIITYILLPPLHHSPYHFSVHHHQHYFHPLLFASHDIHIGYNENVQNMISITLQSTIKEKKRKKQPK